MEEVLIQTDNVNVRILELEAGGALPWHFHSEVTDYVFALDGEIEAQLRSPDEKVALAPGQRCDVPTGRVHRNRIRGHNTNLFQGCSDVSPSLSASLRGGVFCALGERCDSKTN